MITGYSGFGIFVQKLPFRDAYFFFKKNTLLKPLFLQLFLVHVFWPSCQKREILDTHRRKEKKTDNWKALFLVFCVFFVLFFLSFFAFCFLLFFCGFKGQVRWPFGPPHLALNPPYLVFYLFFFGGGGGLFFFLGGGGFKGQVKWPKGPPHLALNPPFL